LGLRGTPLLCLIALCGCLLGGCGADDIFDKPPDLGEVREFDDHALYYAGDEVAGHPLEEVIGHFFLYGRCDPPPTTDAGCPAPLSIHNYDICDWPPSFNDGPLHDFRGAKARGDGTSIEDPMEIFTGHTTVKIGSEDAELTKAAAAALRTVHQSRPPSRLPPPASGSLQGKLPCPDKPGD
jgi:hypothetical protein